MVTSHLPPVFSSSFLWAGAAYCVPAEASEALGTHQVQARAVGMPTGHPTSLGGDRRQERNIWKLQHSVLDLAHMNDALRQFSALS